MNICGVLVHANPMKIASVLAALEQMEGVEVHQTADGGRIVLTVEDTERAAAIDSMTAIHRLDGIVAASLIYHHFEPSADSAGANV